MNYLRDKYVKHFQTILPGRMSVWGGGGGVDLVPGPFDTHKTALLKT